MRLQRRQANLIRWIVDELIPPLVRDSWWFMRLPLRFVLGPHAGLYAGYKSEAVGLSDAEFHDLSEQTLPALLDRETDLSLDCAERVEAAVLGPTVLDVGCGRGWLSERLSESFTVTGSDLFMRLDSGDSTRFRKVIADAENLPFDDGTFDTVVCTHVLEHVRQFDVAIHELRRVSRQRIVIVVPLQRPYRYTFDTHLRFFPYPESFLLAVGAPRFAHWQRVDGDLVYVENQNEEDDEVGTIWSIGR